MKKYNIYWNNSPGDFTKSRLRWFDILFNQFLGNKLQSIKDIMRCRQGIVKNGDIYYFREKL